MGVQVNSVYKSYSLGTSKIEILKDVTFNIRTSEIVALLGSSGSGKSTLLSLLGGLDSVDSGSIKINDLEIVGLKEKELTKYRGDQCSIIFQNYYLVSHLTAFQNVTLPLEINSRKYNDSEIDSLLSEVGLYERRHHTPQQLSGGECQRLAMARALIMKPALLLADEPSGSLDSTTGEKVMTLFFDQVRKNKTTTLLVTHDQQLAKRCDRILSIKQGQLCEI